MRFSKAWMFCGLTLIVAGAMMLGKRAYEPVALADQPQKAAADQYAWRELFDGKTLNGWKSPQFGGEGKVYAKQGTIVMEIGSSMTGVTWTGRPPRENYELELEGMRLDGDDFFCTTTFPVGKDYCSFVVGGWGGCVVGLSNVDHADASENQTSKSMDFKDKRWYKVRIRVTDSAIETWIDGERIVFQPREDHAIDIRIEVDECRPLGVSTWCTKGAVRNIRLRQLRDEEIRDAAAECKKMANNLTSP